MSKRLNILHRSRFERLARSSSGVVTKKIPKCVDEKPPSRKKKKIPDSSVYI